MHAMWVSLKENVHCGNKLNDVVHRPEKYGKERSGTSERMHSAIKIVHQMESPMRGMIFRRNHIQTRFNELNFGDPSRNVIEMIFRAASTNPSKQSRKIKSILRVNNPIDIVENFEKYREMVKKKAYMQYKRHPRSLLDGNELLRFYGTTMTCCSRKPDRVSELCHDFTCRVCRLIQSNFETAYTKKNGIRMNTSSEALSENMTSISKGKNVKRAVIVCRTIGGNEQEFNSIEGEEGQDSNIEYLTVRNPSAVLPCFVIVFT